MRHCDRHEGLTRACLEVDTKRQAITAKTNGNADSWDTQRRPQKHSLAICIKGVHQLAVVHHPRLDLLYWAGRQVGGWGDYDMNIVGIQEPPIQILELGYDCSRHCSSNGSLPAEMPEDVFLFGTASHTTCVRPVSMHIHLNLQRGTGRCLICDPCCCRATQGHTANMVANMLAASSVKHKHQAAFQLVA